jgi:hypothetical protein
MLPLLELKGLVLLFAYCVEVSAGFVLLSKLHRHWRCLGQVATYADFKKEMCSVGVQGKAALMVDQRKLHSPP